MPAGRFVVLSAAVTAQAAVAAVPSASATPSQVPGHAEESVDVPDFVSLARVAPDIRLDVRYFGTDNFVGTRLDGYEAPVCLLSRPAAEALKRAQATLAAFNLRLVVFDCYRPQQTVDHFVRWAKDLDDTRTKAAYYPHVPKEELFARGYIAERSGHSRGSTVDVSIDGLDMGTPFDFFDDSSHARNAEQPAQVRANRALLAQAMEGAGFRGIAEEWWHFTLNNEPWPDRYFNIPVREVTP
jgi:D-alanyl-D-alanine dipeptidase